MRHVRRRNEEMLWFGHFLYQLPQDRVISCDPPEMVQRMLLFAFQPSVVVLFFFFLDKTADLS